MRLALYFVLGIFLSVAGCATLLPKQSAEDRAHAATVLLEFSGDGTCSGTMVGPKVLISAAHCFNDGSILLAVNHRPVNVNVLRYDEHDYVWVTIDTAFASWASIGPALKQGDDVFLYGNPAMERDLFRKGYVVGTARSGATYLDLRANFGDSGSGIFNADGELVGVLSGVQVFPLMMLVTIWPLDSA